MSSEERNRTVYLTVLFTTVLRLNPDIILYDSYRKRLQLIQPTHVCVITLITFLLVTLGTALHHVSGIK